MDVWMWVALGYLSTGLMLGVMCLEVAAGNLPKWLQEDAEKDPEYMMSVDAFHAASQEPRMQLRVALGMMTIILLWPLAIGKVAYDYRRSG